KVPCDSGGPGAGGHRAPVYESCPGCDKCRPHGGYVLRRGSWRCTTAHEYIFMFVKGDRYFCDGEAVKEPSAEATAERNRYSRITEDNADEQYAVRHDHETTATGANPRSVWRIRGEPSRFKHYASFPSGLPRRCIKASTSSAGCCPQCGTPWAPVVEWQAMVIERSGRGEEMGKFGATCTSGKMVSPPMSRVLDYRPSCSCPPADPVPCTVLDPFAGTGTTLAVAVELGQRAIGIELNPAYLPMIRARVENAVEARRIEIGRAPLTGDPAKDAAIEGPRTFF
ncbi:MAG TPA: DNA methyltransferase, partial [Phycisphaerae bacterium]|nr:DNA methyltransferase [Phycisphaerae bacterium]